MRKRSQASYNVVWIPNPIYVLAYCPKRLEDIDYGVIPNYNLVAENFEFADKVIERARTLIEINLNKGSSDKGSSDKGSSDILIRINCPNGDQIRWDDFLKSECLK